MQPVDSELRQYGTEPALAETGSRGPAAHLVDRKDTVMKALIVALLGMSVISLTACNTVAGAGKDVKATGQAIENTAKDAKPK
jgi:predicted small secreted protein